MSYKIENNDTQLTSRVNRRPIDAVAILAANLKKMSVPNNRDTVSAANSVESKENSFLSIPSPEQELIDSEKFLGTDQCLALVAVLGKEFQAQVTSNSQFWDTLFKNGTISMNTSVELAPLIAEAIKTSANEQAGVSKSEAAMNFTQGMIGIFSGIGAIGMGVAGAAKGGNSTDGAQTAQNLTKDAGATANTATNAAERTESTTAAASYQENRTNGLVDKIKNSFAGAPSLFKRGMSFTYKTYEKTLQASQLTGIGMQIGNSFSTWHYKGEMATHQAAQGVADANSKQYEQFASYWDKNFQRQEELRQGFQSNIDLLMKLLDSISSIVAQTSQSMFRA